MTSFRITDVTEQGQSPHSDYATRCYFNLCYQQGSRDDRVSRDVLVFCMYSTLYSVQYGEILLS